MWMIKKCAKPSLVVFVQSHAPLHGGNYQLELHWSICSGRDSLFAVSRADFWLTRDPGSLFAAKGSLRAFT